MLHCALTEFKDVRVQELDEAAVKDFVQAQGKSLVKNIAVKERDADKATNQTANLKCYMPTCSYKTGKGGSHSSLYLYSALQKLLAVDEIKGGIRLAEASGTLRVHMQSSFNEDSNGHYHAVLDWTSDYFPHFSLDVCANETSEDH